MTRGHVFIVDLDPTRGREMRKTRPCVIVSPDELNRRLQTVLIAPMTTKPKFFASRIDVEFRGQAGQIALDQLRVVDCGRLLKHLGSLNEVTLLQALDTLREMFAP